MHCWHVTALLCASSLLVRSGACEQVPLVSIDNNVPSTLQHASNWEERPSEDATGNLIFQSLASLLHNVNGAHLLPIHDRLQYTMSVY